MFKHLLYRLYEGRLFQEVRGGELPRHIGLILDAIGDTRASEGIRHSLRDTGEERRSWRRS